MEIIDKKVYLWFLSTMLVKKSFPSHRMGFTSNKIPSGFSLGCKERSFLMERDSFRGGFAVEGFFKSLNGILEGSGSQMAISLSHSKCGVAH
jgi:hypothetical protein